MSTRLWVVDFGTHCQRPAIQHKNRVANEFKGFLLHSNALESPQQTGLQIARMLCRVGPRDMLGIVWCKILHC